MAGLVRDASSTGQLLSAGASKALLGLSGIGAVASVANLGVSAVGFYVVNKKLNQLKSEMGRLHEAVSEGFSGMETRLVQIQYAIGEVAQGQQVLLAGQEDIKDQSDAANFAPVMTVLQRLEELEDKGKFPSASQADRWLDALRDSRNRYQVLVEKWCTGSKETETLTFARGTGYYQAWAVALVAEARLLRWTGRTGLASELVFKSLDGWYLPTSQSTVQHLLDFHPGLLLAGSFDGRVTTDHFVALMEGRSGRAATMGRVEEWAHEADEAQAKRFGSTLSERRRAMEQLPERTIYSKSAQAYGLIELGRRLNTLGVEYGICERQGLSVEEWEKKPLKDEASGEVHIIPAE